MTIATKIRALTSHKKLLFLEDGFPPIPIANRCFLIANPGSGKTLFLNWLAYLTALGDMPVLILDGESPASQIERNLNRYSLYIDEDWHNLPLTCTLSDELVWEELDKEQIDTTNPSLVIVESITSMSEDLTNPRVGKVIKKTLSKIHDRRRWNISSAHTNQDSLFLTLGELQHLETPHLPRIVSGNTGIVSQGCDVAYLLKQLSQKPLRIAIVVKGRRHYFDEKTYYFELYEPEGIGDDTPMWWLPIPPVKQELSFHALEILALVRERKNSAGEKAPISAKEIMSIAANIEPVERRGIITLLLEQRKIIQVAPFVYIANPIIWKSSELKAPHEK